MNIPKSTKYFPKNRIIVITYEIIIGIIKGING